jgi:2-haloacid dehalogenase
MRINAFLFDIGNVLIDWNPDHLLRKLLPDAAAIRAFRAEAVTQARILEMDRGQDWEAQLAEIEAEAPQHLQTAQVYRARWVETVAGTIPETVALRDAVRDAGWPVYALSNYGAENFERTRGVYPFLDGFDGRVISAHEGVIKPEPAIYRLCIDRFGLDPAVTLFIDDRPENTEAAEALGFQTHTYTCPEALRAELVRLGVSV